MSPSRSMICRYRRTRGESWQATTIAPITQPESHPPAGHLTGNLRKMAYPVADTAHTIAMDAKAKLKRQVGVGEDSRNNDQNHEEWRDSDGSIPLIKELLSHSDTGDAW
jgi:hypothetical protein